VNRFRFSNLSRNGRWTLILAEIAACYILIYVSAYFEWPKREYFRFTVVLPLYQAGVAFGYSGGIISSIVAALLFMPLFPTDPLITGDPAGEMPTAIGMVVFIIFFGVFVGGAIGAARKTQSGLETLSHISYNIARETGEGGIMRQLAREALALLETRYAAVLIRGSQGADRVMFALSDTDPDGKKIADFDSAHPLVWAADNDLLLISNSARSDERFTACPPGDSMKSLMVLPVVSEETVYGSLLLSGKKSGNPFSDEDLAMARLLADTAGDTIHNMEQETERQEQQLREAHMKELFSRYVSSTIADYVLENPKLLEGRWQEVTILVSDIRDFTSICEKSPPKQIVGQLNEYFTVMVDIIFENKGTIDKFIGDCIIAYWGAPAPDYEHPIHAAQAAADMAHALDALNEKWKVSGKQVFRTGIALHTCSVLMGNIGDDRKRAFTILGEEVERAIALESLTKSCGARIIASRKTSEAVSGAFPLKRIPDEDTGGIGELCEIETD